MHVKQQIREYVKTLLTGLPTTGLTVYESRVYPHDVVPSLAIYTGEDSVVGEQTLGRLERHELEVIVEVRVKPAEGQASPEDQIDTICAEVQAAIAANPKLGGLVKIIEYSNAPRPRFEGDLERPVGYQEIVFRAEYRIIATDPQTAIPG